MITSISLQRFRGFENVKLDLKPLTVLLGANSAGKSSFLHALAALHFIRRVKISPATLSPVGLVSSSWPLDLGTRTMVQRDGTLGDGGVEIRIGVSHENRAAEIAYEFGRRNSGESLDLSGIDIHDEPESVRIQAGATSHLHSVMAPIEAMTGVTATSATAALGHSGHPQVGRTIVREVGEGFWQVPDGEAIVVAIKNLHLEYYGRRSSLGTGVAVQSAGQRHLLEALDQVRYLRPNRSEPLREYDPRPPTVPNDDVGPIGEWAAETWIAHRQTQIQFRCPPPLRLSRVEAEGLLENPKSPAETISLEEGVDRWLDRLGIARRVLAAQDGEGAKVSVRVALNGQQDRGLPDVGFGVSQVLPVIIQGLALPEGGTLLVEQPEAQLHPRPQAHLADFFCSLVEHGRNCLIETHSETFFRRLHLRALLDPDLASKMNVYFISPVSADGCCRPELVRLDVDATVPWPKEFLAEGIRAHATFAAVRAALAKNAPHGAEHK